MMDKTHFQLFEFSTLSKWLHWSVMFLMVLQIIAGIAMEGLEESDPLRMQILRTHGIIGLLIVITTLARIVIRLRRPHPTPEGMTEKWNIWLHDVIQWAIYIVLLGIGLTGMGTLGLNNMNAFTADPLALDRTVPIIRGHVLMILLVIVLTLLHVGGVMRHQFTRSNVLRRMGLNLRIGKGKMVEG